MSRQILKTETQILETEVRRLYRDQPDICKRVLNHKLGVDHYIHGMIVHTIPVWIHTAHFIHPRRVALGMVNGIWTLCVAPKYTNTEAPEFKDTPWNDEGSLIHLSSVVSSGENGRLNTILFAVNMSEKAWLKFKKQEPTCLAVLYPRNLNY